MIPELPPIDLKDRIKFYESLVKRIELAGMSHVGWYTHKNPYGCWMCDGQQLLWKLLAELDDLANKS